MDAASTNASPAAKVIIQCTDPSNLFDSITPLLQPRLPLSNLHWKSASRPLRSIDSLDISFIREEFASAKNTARHQIPGLRQTPYLKVYLLRCDDKEKYKDSARKEVKDWVKSLAISTSGKSTIKGQERHDAFEYLIVHVVLAGTAAATQPKSSKHISLEASDSTDSVNSTSKSKWTGKSSSTIYDKLRADFHSSSKAPFERVAQVRLPDTTKPSTVLSPLELEEQWQDLVEKLKTAILQSFDTRVAQYEEDIREREAQRNLPGWNFCTFFILKEGLARGFENVGLLEDALQVYEELDAGLDVVIQDQANDNYTDATNALLPYATDLKDTIRKVLDSKVAAETEALEAITVDLQAWTVAESKQFPWRLERRDYQQMILTNQVSALDFRIYIFIRQMQITLRRANVPISAPRSKIVQRVNMPRWDANLLYSVCERSIRFLGLAARNLRQDLFAAWGGQEGLPESERQIQSNVINNIVASWKWSSLLQTLNECHIMAALSNIATRDTNREQRKGELFNARDISETWRTRNRNYSIATNSSGENDSLTNDVKSALYQDLFSAIHVVQGNKGAFIFQAAEVFLMLRNVLIEVGKDHGVLRFLHPENTHNAVSCDSASVNLRGILAISLRKILKTEEIACASYKLLTVCACQCYLTAGKTRASRQLCYDLANLEAFSGNYDAAMAWLDSIPGFLDEPKRTAMDYFILQLHITCFRHSERFEELSRSLLLSLQSLPQGRDGETFVQQAWSEITSSTKSCEDIDFAFDSVFAIEEIQPFITQTHDAGGFGIWILIRALVPLHVPGWGEFHVELRSKNHTVPETIVLKYTGQLLFQQNLLKIFATSSVCTDGWYQVTGVELIIGSLRFQHRFISGAKVNSSEESFFPEYSGFNILYIYTGPKSPRMTISDCPTRDMSKQRTALISINWISHQKSILKPRLRLKPATAGLRLDLQNVVEKEHSDFRVVQAEDAWFIEFFSLDSTESLLEVPYLLENNAILSITIHAEMTYSTTDGSFHMFETLSTSCILPISVNVQDIFQADATFSQFTLAPSRPIPIRINSCSLTASEKYHISSTTPKPMSMDAFARQPISWIAKIVDGYSGPEADTIPARAARQLELAIGYKCVDEVILRAIRDEFVASISNTQFVHATRPLLTHLSSKLQSIWTEHEIELAMLIGELEMWTFEELDWAVILYAFDKNIRSELAFWLHEWHNTHQMIELKFGAAPQRLLKLLVDAPQIPITITTSVELTQRTSGSTQSIEEHSLGQPLSAKLKVTSKCLSQVMKAVVEISIEVINQHETWLIGGERKATFDLDQELFETSLTLIPQKTGSLTLPLIDIKCRRKDDSAPVSIEAEHLSCATTINVSEGVSSTVLGIGDGESSAGYWLIDGQGKGKV